MSTYLDNCCPRVLDGQEGRLISLSKLGGVKSVQEKVQKNGDLWQHARLSLIRTLYQSELIRRHHTSLKQLTKMHFCADSVSLASHIEFIADSFIWAPQVCPHRLRGWKPVPKHASDRLVALSWRTSRPQMLQYNRTVNTESKLVQLQAVQTLKDVSFWWRFRVKRVASPNEKITKYTDSNRLGTAFTRERAWLSIHTRCCAMQRTRKQCKRSSSDDLCDRQRLVAATWKDVSPSNATGLFISS